MSEEKTPLLTRISKELATLMDGHANREHVVLPFLHQLVAELPEEDRIEALERENAALRDDDAKMQLLHRQEDQLIAAERKIAELEAKVDAEQNLCRRWQEKADALDLARAVPDGWKLVPVELTSEMCTAGYDAVEHEIGMVEVAVAYRAMIAASPAAPQQGGE